MKAISAVRRFVPRYSLRTLVIVLTLACIVCGFWMNGPLRQRAAVRHLKAINPPFTARGGGMGGGLGGFSSFGGPPQGIDMMVIAYRAQGRDDHHRLDIHWWQQPFAAVLGEDAFGEITGVQLMTLPATDDDLQYVARLCSIERINLAGTNVTDIGLKKLRGCSKLTFISLEDTNITDAGLAELMVLQNLQGLSLSGTKITDASLSKLEKLPQLTQLWIKNTAITQAGFNRLYLQMPACEIEANPHK